MRKFAVLFLAMILWLSLFVPAFATNYSELQITIYPGRGINVNPIEGDPFTINLGDDYRQIYLLGQPEDISFYNNYFYISYNSYGLGFLVQYNEIRLINVWNNNAASIEGAYIGAPWEIVKMIYGEGRVYRPYDLPYSPTWPAIDCIQALLYEDRGLTFYGTDWQITCISVFFPWNFK